MKKILLSKKFWAISAISTVVAILFIFLTYLVILPALVSNTNVIGFVQKVAKSSLGADLTVEKPVLKTSFSPVIEFSVDKMSVFRGKDEILNIQNFDTSISYASIFKKRIIVNKLGADYIYLDVNKLLALVPGQENKQSKPPEIKPDLFNSLLYVKKCIIKYQFSKDTGIVYTGNNFEITAERNPKYLHFDIILDVINKGKKLTFKIKDNNCVYAKNRKFIVDNCALEVNKSKMYLNAELSESGIKANFNSRKFDVANVVELIRTNFIIPNGSEMLSYFKDISGDFNFNVDVTNKGLSGFINLNKGKLTLIPLADLKLTINSGYVDIKPDVITLSDIKGYYCDDKNNTVDIKGTIKDYYKSFETDVIVKALARKEFSKNHLSKIVGYPLEIVGVANALIYYKSKFSDMNVWCAFMLKKGNDILVDGASLSPVNYDRVATVDIDLDPDVINIKKINYYIASTIDRNSKIKPLLTIWSKLDAKTCALKNIGFTIPRPLPSEFLNVLIGQKVFRKGKISGDLELIADTKVPYIKANMAMDKVAVPAQRLFIRSAKFTAEGDKIQLTTVGKFKRSDYNLTGTMLNEIKLPVIIKDVNLTVDNIDLERIIASMNAQNTKTSNAEAKQELVVADENNLDENANIDSAPVFDTGLLIVENCVFNLVKGKYKNVNFGNLKATLTLDENGILNVFSNRFDIAEGISSCKINCDLVKHKYHLVLGVKDVNSDILATSILGLSREISGKASGIISLDTDDSLKLDGFIKFAVNNGTIGKIGLIEYVLKFAALFRNPIAMLSPSTIFDIVNIPEGNFDKIEGDLELKNNVLEKIIIKSRSSQLSSLIVGKFDLTTRDATLRIYTKFSSQHKGFGGFMRNLSLNSIARRVSTNSRNDSAYYSAELKFLPPIDADEKDCQVFLTKVDGDVEKNNFISSLRKIK